jgi:hypothetical protein
MASVSTTKRASKELNLKLINSVFFFGNFVTGINSDPFLVLLDYLTTLFSCVGSETSDDIARQYKQ